MSDEETREKRGVEGLLLTALNYFLLPLFSFHFSFSVSSLSSSSLSFHGFHILLLFLSSFSHSHPSCLQPCPHLTSPFISSFLLVTLLVFFSSSLLFSFHLFSSTFSSCPHRHPLFFLFSVLHFPPTLFFFYLLLVFFVCTYSILFLSLYSLFSCPWFVYPPLQ